MSNLDPLLFVTRLEAELDSKVEMLEIRAENQKPAPLRSGATRPRTATSRTRPTSQASPRSVRRGTQ
jgi:hypothetical protein